MRKKAIFVFGRFNPPTIGHKRMINKMIKDAKKNKADPFIVITHTQDKKKNPFSPDEKKRFLSKMYPNVPILGTSKEKPNPKYIVDKLKNMKYNDISMMVGSDRAKSFGWVGVPIKTGGKRNDNAKGAEGMSATKARQAAINNDKNTFRKSVDESITDKELDNMMKIIKSRMTVKK